MREDERTWRRGECYISHDSDSLSRFSNAPTGKEISFEAFRIHVTTVERGNSSLECSLWRSFHVH